MGRYQAGDHVKFEVKDEKSGEFEWIWLLVDRSDDGQQVVFGQLDSEPVVATGMKRGQLLAVSYQQARDHKKPSEFYLYNLARVLPRLKKFRAKFLKPTVGFDRRCVSWRSSLIAVCGETQSRTRAI